MSEWIKTEEDLPKNNQIVLVCDVYSNLITLAQYLEDEDCFNLMNIETIEGDSYPSHWMPLPGLPKD